MSATQKKKKFARWKNQWQPLSKVFQVQVQKYNFSIIFPPYFSGSNCTWDLRCLCVCVCMCVCFRHICEKLLYSSFVFCALLCKSISAGMDFMSKFKELHWTARKIYKAITIVPTQLLLCNIHTENKNDSIYKSQAQEIR